MVVRLRNPNRQQSLERAQWRWDPAIFHEIVPHVRSDELGCIKHPHPPKLPVDLPSVECATVCAKWTASVVLRDWGAAPKGALNARWTARKGWPALERGILLLRDNKISPVSWLCFRRQTWSDRGMHRAPTFQELFVFGYVSQWLERAKDFVPEKCGTILTSPTYEAFIRLQTAMQLKIMQVRPTEVAPLKAIVAEFFPGNKFDMMVAKARAELQSQHDAIVADIAKFKWVW